MNSVAECDSRAVEEAFALNRLLSTLPSEAKALIARSARIVELERGAVIQDPGSNVHKSLFLLGKTMVSLVIEIDSGRSIEVASIGNEGAVGGIVSCGEAPAFARAQVQIEGQALEVSLETLEQAKQQSGHIRNLFCRFSDYLLSQVMRSVACNSFHSIDQRAAGWLLTAQDRGGDRVQLTQEAFAALLGVQRTSVNAAARELQDEGLIVSRRGVIEVIDRVGLKRRACSCYADVAGHFTAMIGASGSGGDTVKD